jgi:hypothetical protein
MTTRMGRIESSCAGVICSAQKDHCLSFTPHLAVIPKFSFTRFLLFKFGINKNYWLRRSSPPVRTLSWLLIADSPGFGENFRNSGIPVSDFTRLPEFW